MTTDMLQALKSRVSHYTHLLTDPQWKPTRSYFESARNGIGAAVEQIEDRDKEIARLQMKFDNMLKAEHELSDAYLRLRKLIPGAFNTHGLSTMDMWDHVEHCLMGLAADARKARENAKD